MELDCNNLADMARAEVRRVPVAAWRAKGPSEAPMVHIRRSKSTYEVVCEPSVHPAANRMPAVRRFIEERVLPRVRFDVSGSYRFEPHDASRDANLPTLCFSRNLARDDRRSILFPDLYQMFGYRGQFDACLQDDLSFEQKSSSAVFAGVTTGSEDPAANKRIAACVCGTEWDFADFRITNVCQMTSESLVKHLGKEMTARICRPFLSQREQYMHRYILNVQGNTCCWSRVPMILMSRSVMIDLAGCEEGTWYYPSLKRGVHYVGLDNIDDLPEVLQRCEADLTTCANIVRHGNAFFGDFCTVDAGATYAARVLEEVARATRAANSTH